MSIETWKSGDLVTFVVDGEKRRAIITEAVRDPDDSTKWLLRFIPEPDFDDQPSS